MNTPNSQEGPVETILEFVFYSLFPFTPKNFEPSWLFRNEILHSREVKEVNIIRINEAEVFYSTDIISFNITYDSMSIKTNSSLAYESLLTISKRIVNVLRTDLKPEFNFNIRYHFRHPLQQKVTKNMTKLLIDSFWNGIIDDPLLRGASISKSVQKKEFLWNSDINVSICRRPSAKGQLIHVFFNNFLDLDETPIKRKEKDETSIKGKVKDLKRTIGKFIRLDNDLSNVLNRCEEIAIKLTNTYFSDK